MKGKIGYIINVDVGPLERKTILLIESILRFVDNNPFIIIVKPNMLPLGEGTMEYFKSRLVHFHEIEMKNFYSTNIIMSKIFISAYAEAKYSEYVDYLLFLDNDTIFLNNIENDLLDNNFSLGVRPTEFADTSLRSFEACSQVWKFLLHKFEIKYDCEWKMKTTVDSVDTYASFNSGFILEKARTDFYQKWKGVAEVLHDDAGFINILHEDAVSLHYLDQILLSIVMMKHFKPSDVKILNDKYNFSLEQVYFNYMIQIKRTEVSFKKLPVEIDSLIHIHYHSRFNERRIIYYFKREDHRELLKPFVPFHQPFKKTLISFIRYWYTFTQFIVFKINNAKRN